MKNDDGSDMTKTKGYKLARSLMDAHGLEEWGLDTAKAIGYAGMCAHSIKFIILANWLLKADEKIIKDVVVHEIAHAKNPEDGHGEKWTQTCVDILGYKLDSDIPFSDLIDVLPKPTYFAECPNNHVAIGWSEINYCTICNEDTKYIKIKHKWRKHLRSLVNGRL